ncbi:MAG TPA: riboflavin kinase [Bacteroidales bacterium]|jgi:riboflavin kinase/FMN adenylyltransferase|nr:hypothetical protein [Bacteroidales bacterium]HOF16009.1 riboflavin kinase [Bacteroidales bacterium]HOR82547.1 riboflavin kinase [Bacteroidales bacterium]HPJ91007.1 riboflavin kinase [Bacteroidales bacterium]
MNSKISYPSFEGKVIKGNQIGRKLGFPTANIDTPTIPPKKGVYIAEVNIENKKYYGLLNVGVRPTLQYSDLRVEIHIFDFNEDIYSKNLRITPLFFIRDEQKLDNMAALKQQIEKDKTFALAWLKQ